MSETKQLPVETIKLWEPRVRLPISDADLLSGSWRASEMEPRLVLVTTMPSERHPEFVHYEVQCVTAGEWWTSKHPVPPSHAGDFLAHILRPLHIDVTAMNWRRCDAKAPDAARSEPGKTQEFVYFLGAGPFVKIGKSTGSPDARIRDLQTGCPYPISLLAHVTGGLQEEFALHRRFAAYRKQGEWFRHEGELAEHIAAIRRDGE